MRVDRALRKTCNHETGHATVIERMGGSAKVVVLPPNDLYGWAGFCRFIDMPSAPQSNWLALVGLAGIVSELLAADVTDLGQITYAVARNRRTASLSDSDSELMGEDWAAHVPEAVEILQATWPDVVAAALRLERRALGDRALGWRLTA